LSRVTHVVIIDDDESLRDSLKGLIAALGYSAESFSSAEDFLRSDVIRTASCIITDVQMPGMNGIELQQRLSALGLRTPIIFMTASPNEASHSLVLRNGAVGYLSKPLDQKNFLACLHKALDTED
jgi:FixJ family two-component response regulator